MLVLTRADAPEKKHLLAQVRQGIETSFSQLWQRFLDRVFSRSWLGLWNTIQRKVIHYNLCHAGILLCIPLKRTINSAEENKDRSEATLTKQSCLSLFTSVNTGDETL
jgi:hypothetical protein